MDQLIKSLDKNLKYLEHDIKDNIFYISVESERKEVKCPFCGTSSSRCHSYYQRTFQDLPIQGKKVKILLNNRKMRCVNPDCSHKTFSERFDCVGTKDKNSKRLIDEIVEVSLNMSSVVAAEYLSKKVVDIKKSSICNYIKKRDYRG